MGSPFAGVNKVCGLLSFQAPSMLGFAWDWPDIVTAASAQNTAVRTRATFQ
jgi:hypothetical protein